MLSKPIRELIATPLDRGIRAYQHGYPSDVTIWHYHPEYELHAIRRSSGLFYVGTYCGSFKPGNLVLTGPNLPHMWVTDRSGYDEGETFGDFIPDRDLVIQFSGEFAGNCVEHFGDCAPLSDLMTLSTAGLVFSEETSRLVLPLMEELTQQNGPRRLSIFFEIIDLLALDKDRQSLSVEWHIPRCQNPRRLDNILGLIAANHDRSDFTCTEVAEAENMELSTFSRFFERHMHCTCIEYINRLRIFKACQLLIETDARITGVAYDVGYGTLSTFNRNFQRFIGLSPSAFRAQWRYGETVGTETRAS
ncbi:AraC family transcriptional regulator [Tropicimonas isoalkanivorans]|uniref:Transcriptional regulator, AraC family n=1 Tax=Tropicimonas isoalkanivorans TaxID=441112 RepID=A0A1I1ICV1_9RHOB|nr:AraC family transcriptional regulator [Tropicimonas isoalkanivorans]SFC33945.1 transcriptional regulator, AraC family [Tropicimonas isoalkanivorans]